MPNKNFTKKEDADYDRRSRDRGHEDRRREENGHVTEGRPVDEKSESEVMTSTSKGG